MTYRFWYQSMTESGIHGIYREAIASHCVEIFGDAIEIEVHGVRAGTYGGMPPVSVLKYPYLYHVLLQQVIENAIGAQKHGFHGFVLGSYSEPFLREIRCAVDIPVVSMAESTLLVGCSVAAQAGLVTVTEEVAWMTKHIVDRHHLQPRIAAITSMDPPVTEDDLAAAFANPQAVIDTFIATARTVIAQHADVIIPAEGVLNELLSANGLRQIDGVPVMDCVGVTLAYAQMMAILREHTNLTVGRRWEYPIAPLEMATLVGNRS